MPLTTATPSPVFVGTLGKMHVTLHESVRYQLPVGDRLLPLNDLLGQQLTLEYLGEILCRHCGRKTKKSFSQGYCYPCFKKLPQCDSCIIRPEHCHYHQGTCRDPGWGEQFCMTDHIVYVANASGLKVGITRANQVPIRWIDQGASQAMPFIRVTTRRLSGLLEQIFRENVSDRTNWRAMLKGPADPIDLAAAATELLAQHRQQVEALQATFGLQAVQPLADAAVLTLHYPVQHYPTKITALSLDKTPVITGSLQGIKGQYLLLDSGVLNIRKHTAYQVKVAVAW